MPPKQAPTPTSLDSAWLQERLAAYAAKRNWAERRLPEAKEVERLRVLSNAPIRVNNGIPLISTGVSLAAMTHAIVGNASGSFLSPGASWLFDTLRSDTSRLGIFRSFLAALPVEILLNICRYLLLSDLMALARTSKYFFNLLDDAGLLVILKPDFSKRPLLRTINFSQTNLPVRVTYVSEVECLAIQKRDESMQLIHLSKLARWVSANSNLESFPLDQLGEFSTSVELNRQTHEEVEYLDLTKAGKKLVVATHGSVQGSSYKIKVIDADTGSATNSFEYWLPYAQTLNKKMYPISDSLICVGNEVVDITTGQCKVKIERLEEQPVVFCMSDDKTVMAFLYEYGIIKLVNAKTLNVITTFVAEYFNNSFKYILISGDYFFGISDEKAWVYDLTHVIRNKQPDPLYVYEFSDQPSVISSVAISSDGNHIAVIRNQWVDIYGVNNGQFSNRHSITLNFQPEHIVFVNNDQDLAIVGQTNMMIAKFSKEPLPRKSWLAVKEIVSAPAPQPSAGPAPA